MPNDDLSKRSRKNFKSVLIQQGRVPLDSDLNEKNNVAQNQVEKLQMNSQMKAFIGEVKRHGAGSFSNTVKDQKSYLTLFSGSTVTGRTSTAELFAKQLNKELYKVDLSKVVSKYIGETEKNLELVFARAEEKGWILFFDEADALFGKRTNVQDAHDKYANQEVSYLLERISKHNGLVIISTNNTDFDKSFPVKFDKVIKFPLSET